MGIKKTRKIRKTRKTRKTKRKRKIRVTRKARRIKKTRRERKTRVKLETFNTWMMTNFLQMNKNSVICMKLLPAESLMKKFFLEVNNLSNEEWLSKQRSLKVVNG